MCAGSPGRCHRLTGEHFLFPAALPAQADGGVSPQLEVVIGFCCDFLFSWLDENNVVEVYRLADVYGLQQLKAKVHSYLLRTIRTFSRTPAFRLLPPDEVFRALSSDRLQVSGENQVYEAALHYHFSPEQVESERVDLQVSVQVGGQAALWGESDRRVTLRSPCGCWTPFASA